MNNAETLTTALANLATHKLRTALTMLGMIFGVGAVIAMLSIGAGGEKKALEAIGRLGLRNVIVKAKVVKPDDRAELRKKSLGVSLRDGEAIVEAVPNVEMVLPRVEVKPYKILAPDTKTLGKVFGVSSRYPKVASVALAEGRMFDAKDEAEYAQVCVIGDEIRRNLFGYGPAIGKQLKVNDVWLEVVGIFAGERRVDIRAQFVIESFAISVIGGIAGIIIGIVLARLVAAYAGWPTVITIGSLLLATGVSVTVGLVSGIYPAARAAELDPIQALRYE